ncbi:MAG: hypothetical protein PHS14_16080 [Elusimicrobia bacterium]|nr:hypothetical protein [Elusimicrobiota bacterium]
MDALELAYTPHPAARPRVTPMAVSGSSRRAEGTRGLAAAAVASLALIGSTALMAFPRGTQAPESVPTEARPFERRETAPASALAMTSARVAITAEPTPVETRAASPLPLAGDALGPEPDAAAAQAVVASAPREQHVLTSFDGARTMTDGPVIVRADAPSAEPQRRAFPPSPVVWNHPVQWISVHKQGL